MGGDEGKGCIGRERNALARWRECGNRVARRRSDRRIKGASTVQIDVAFGQVCKRLEPLTQVSVLPRLDKPQMPLRQKGYVAGERAEDANATLFYCIAHQAAVSRASDAV